MTKRLGLGLLLIFLSIPQTATRSTILLIDDLREALMRRPYEIALVESRGVFKNFFSAHPANSTKGGIPIE